VSTYTIAVASQKGGVGKTVNTVFLADFLKQAGYRPLVIDLDSQMNSTSWLLGRHLEPNEASIYDSLITKQKGMQGEADWPLSDLIEESENVGIDYVPASRDLSVADSELSNSPFVLQDRLDELMEEPEIGRDQPFDFCLLDCPPSLGSLVYVALTASDGVIIPVKAAQFSMDGLGQLVRTVQEVQRINDDLEIIGLLLNNLDWRFGETKHGVKQIEEAYGDLVFETKVPLRAKIVEASRGKSPSDHVKGTDAEEIYQNLTSEVVERTIG
jgi:chromosome partitioning protein